MNMNNGKKIYIVETDVKPEDFMLFTSFCVEAENIFSAIAMAKIKVVSMNAKVVDVYRRPEERNTIKELASEIHDLEDFMRTKQFYLFPREEKDLLYDKLHAMLSYIQVLGKIAENDKVQLDLWD